MSRRFIGLVLLAVFLVQTTGCYSWGSRPPETISEPEVMESESLRLKLTSGDEVEVRDVVINEERRTVSGRVVTINGMRQNPPTPMQFTIEEIQEFSIREFNGQKTFLAVVGIPALTLAAFALIVALTKESCPFLYVEEEEGLELRGELYSGAVFAEVERTDLLKLGELTPVGHRVRLRLANEALETQYTDELTLLAVDHPRGTQVAPGIDGTIHTLGVSSAPLTAAESRRGSVLAQVEGHDDLIWVPEPYERDLSDPADLRDQLVVSFPRPQGASQAKLVARIRNTYWADHAFGSFLALLGSQMNTWYASEGRKMTPGVWGTDFMAKHGLSLTVERKGAQGWEEAGAFFPTGPIGWQEEVLTIPLDPSAVSETLDLRLTGGGMFWMVDQVAVDFGSDVPLVIHELSPEAATDQDGVDVAGLLTAADNQYHVMPQPGHYADVTYRVPPRDPAMERTYLVRSEGYYIIHQKNSGPPDYGRLANIQSDPDGFLRFSMERFWLANGYAPPESSHHPN